MTYRLVIKSAQIQQEQIILDTQQLHYLLRVLRLGNGDRFLALDGIGNAWVAEIRDRSAQIIQSVAIKTELPICLSLMTALPKASGYEQVIRCCTEIGVSNFIPVISDRTLLKPNSNKVQRWRKIATEAAEQSERQIVPKIVEPIKYIAAIEQVETTQNKYICVARGDIPTLWHSLQQTQSPVHLRKTKVPAGDRWSSVPCLEKAGLALDRLPRSEILIATGCEGGWTETEIAKAIALGFQPVSLGNRILRAITAPIVASSIVMAVLEAKS